MTDVYRSKGALYTMVEHYCQGVWVKGWSSDCPEPEHAVKLQKERDGQKPAPRKGA